MATKLAATPISNEDPKGPDKPTSISSRIHNKIQTQKQHCEKRRATYVIYSKKVDKGSVAWHSMCLYSSTSLRVHFSTIVVVCNGEGSASMIENQPSLINNFKNNTEIIE